MQFIKGHAHMNRHQNLMDEGSTARTDEDVEITSPTYRFCNKGEVTPYHFVLECEETAEDSHRYLKDQPPNRDKTNTQFNWKVYKLIQFLANSTLNPLFGINDKEENEDDITSEANPDDDPHPNSDGDENSDDNITMRDLWNRPLSRSL